MTKKLPFAILLSVLLFSNEIFAMDRFMKWFQTWDRPEYQEWAASTEDGYLLHIVRKEKENWLVVQAKLLMGESGLPGFEVIEQKTVPAEEIAYAQVKTWEEALTN